jgi:hypothetical protein
MENQILNVIEGTKPPMTKKEIIKEIALPYLKDPSIRASAGLWACQFLTKEGKKCAIGSMLKEDNLKTCAISHFVNDFWQEKVSLPLPEHFQEKYLGHENSFYASVREFHNTWSKDPKDNEIRYNNLLNKYSV